WCVALCKWDSATSQDLAVDPTEERGAGFDVTVVEDDHRDAAVVGPPAYGHGPAARVSGAAFRHPAEGSRVDRMHLDVDPTAPGELVERGVEAPLRAGDGTGHP